MKYPLLFLFAIIYCPYGFSQVGIGTTTPTVSSMLEISSQNKNAGNYKGFMPPRVPNIAARDNIDPAVEDAGLLVFVNSIGCLQVWSGHVWVSIRCVEVQADPVLLGRQFFEITQSIPNLPYSHSGNGIYINDNTFVPRYPNSHTYVSSDTGFGVNQGTTEVIFGPIDTSAFDMSRILLRLASFSRTPTDGADLDDTAVIAISIDGGNTYSDELVVTGNVDSRWGFNDGVARLDYDGDFFPLTVTASSGISIGVTKIRITSIPATTNLMFKVTLTNDHYNEIWVIDNAEVYGY